MGKSFFLKLAFTNLIREKRMYIPYFIAHTAMVCIYFMLVTIVYTKGIADVPSIGTLQQMFAVGMIVMNLFTVIFVLYINSFLIKRRKKEFGLYGILGLEKRHVGRVVIWESIILGMVSIIIGIISGLVFGRLIFLLIFYTMKVSVNMKFIVPVKAFIYTGVLFIGIMITANIYNLLHVRLASPIHLLKGEQVGEKKVRFVIPLTIIGVVALGWAYYSALTVQHAMTALTKFMIAVIVVIFATQILFTTGSIFFLNILKNNKKIYYKSNNFIAISSMFHRMKQNAAGLSNICILSTMVLVIVSTCTALYLGQEDILGIMNPDDVIIKMSEDAKKEQITSLDDLINETSNQYNVKVEDNNFYYAYTDTIFIKDNKIIATKLQDHTMSSISEAEEYLWDVNYITLEDFNRICNTNESLQENEVIILGNKDELKQKEVTGIADGKFLINKIIYNTVLTKGKNGATPKMLFIVAKDETAARNLIPTLMQETKEINFNRITTLNVSGNRQKLTDFAHTISSKGNEIENVYFIRTIFEDRESGYGIYGGLLFLGAFFTVLFLVATVLIIYFKQVSEGYDDKERFVILQKVGMDDREVKRTINKQILIVFFLPLIVPNRCRDG